MEMNGGFLVTKIKQLGKVTYPKSHEYYPHYNSLPALSLKLANVPYRKQEGRERI